MRREVFISSTTTLKTIKIYNTIISYWFFYGLRNSRYLIVMEFAIYCFQMKIYIFLDEKVFNIAKIIFNHPE